MILLPLLNLLFLFLGDVCAQSEMPSYDFIHHVTLDAGRREVYSMMWTPEEKFLVVEVQVASLGYVGLGFSPTGGMGGSDIFFAWVDDSGMVKHMDMHARDNAAPIKDPSQDYDLIGGYENGTHTVIRFSRPWTTCDDRNDWLLNGDTVKVIWAYSDEDPRDEFDLKYHGVHRGTKNMLLMEPPVDEEVFNDDLITWEIRAPNVELPPDMRTFYWCKMYKIPDMKKKTHFVGYVPMVQESTALYVHHMILYECTGLDNSYEFFEKYVDSKGTQCYGANMPPSWDRCANPIIVWAIGSSGEAFPDHVGLPLGDEHGGSTYHMLEVHYDNPNLDAGVVDASGLRLYMTDDLREQDAGTLWLGHQTNPIMVIPPGTPDWITMGQCSAECTRQKIPEGGIKAFAGFLHTHLLGEAVHFRHIRDGKELPTILKDDHYDFNYQQNRVLREEMTILPGDTIMVECFYNSSTRMMPTFGGEATLDEMCLGFLTYYPRLPWSRCESRPSLSTFVGAFGVKELFPSPYAFVLANFRNAAELEADKEGAAFASQQTPEFGGRELQLGKLMHFLKIKEPLALQNRSIYELLLNPGTWQRPGFIDNFQRAMVLGVHDDVCTSHGGRYIPRNEVLNYPVFEPYKPPPRQCIPSGKRGMMPKNGGRAPPFASTSTSTASTEDTTTVTTTTKTSFATIITSTTVFEDGTTRTSTTTSSNMRMR